MIEAIHAGNDVNPPGLATTETLTQHVNLNYFSEAVSSEVKARLADADSRQFKSRRPDQSMFFVSQHLETLHFY